MGYQMTGTKGVIIPIPKKGTLSDCNNWRGITLLSLPSKIFCKLIEASLFGGQWSATK